jgi:hypothetical protein
MVPDAKPAPEGATFPFVRIAVGVLVLNAILTVSYPKNLVASAVGIAASFAFGYCVLALIAGGRLDLSAAEVLAFTVGLTIFMTSLSAIAVSVAGIPITPLAVVIVGLPVGMVAMLVRRSSEPARNAALGLVRRLFDFSDYSKTEKGIAGVLLGAIAAGLVVFLLLSAVHYPDRSSMGVSITGADGKADSIPASFPAGQPQTIIVSVVANSTPGWPATGPGSFVVRIRLVPANATGTEPFHSVPAATPVVFDAFGQANESFLVAPGETWTKSISFVVSSAGSYSLRLDLVRAADIVVAGTRVPIDVR